MKDEYRMATIERLGPRHAAALFVGATIPDDYRAAAGAPLKVVVREGVVLHLHCEALDRRVHRWAFGHRPGPHDAGDLEADVEVVSARLVLLDDEDSRRDAADRELLMPFDRNRAIRDGVHTRQQRE